MTAVRVKSIRAGEYKSLSKKEDSAVKVELEEPVVNGGLKGILELLTKFVTVGGDFAE